MSESLKAERWRLAVEYCSLTHERRATADCAACAAIRYELRELQRAAMAAERARWERFLKLAFTEGFMGWWDVEDKEDCPEPYERFKLMLFGEEAGDTLDFALGARSLLDGAELALSAGPDLLDGEEA